MACLMTDNMAVTPGMKARMSEPNCFYLGQLCGVQVLASRYDGAPYLRLSRDIPYNDQEVVQLSVTSFNNLVNAADQIDDIWSRWAKNEKNPDNYFPLGNAAGASVSADLEGDEDLAVLKIERYLNQDQESYQEINLPYEQWARLLDKAERINRTMQEIEAHKVAGESQVPLRLNFKTLVKAEQEPPALIFIREHHPSYNWTYKISGEAAADLARKHPKIREALDLGLEKTEKLADGPFHVKTMHFQDKMYVGFVNIDPKGNRMRGMGMNIDAESYKTLHKNMDNLLDSMCPDIFRGKASSREEIAKTGKDFRNKAKAQAQGEGRTLHKRVGRQNSTQSVRGNTTERQNSIRSGYEGDDEVAVVSDDTDDDDDDIELSQPVKAKTPLNKRSLSPPATPPAPKKPKVVEARRPMQTLHFWTWKTRGGKALLKSPYVYYTRAMSYNEAERMKPSTEGDLMLDDGTTKVEKMKAEDVIGKTIIHYMTWKFNNRMTVECAGCEDKCLGQEGHKEGCMLTWEQCVELYFDLIKSKVHTPECFAWIRNMLESMGYSCMAVPTRTKLWMKEHGHKLKPILLHDVLDESFIKFLNQNQPRE